MTDLAVQTDERYIRIEDSFNFYLNFEKINNSFNRFSFNINIEKGDYTIEDLALELETKINNFPSTLDITFSADIIHNRINISFDDDSYIAEVFCHLDIEFIVNFRV